MPANAITQVSTIGDSLISSTQWGYLSSSNQRIDSDYLPTFAGISLSANSMQTSGTFGFATGTVSAPTIYFGESSSSGFFQPTDNQVGISASNQSILVASTNGIKIINGSVDQPSIFFEDSKSGLYRSGEDEIGVSINSTHLVNWAANSQTIKGLDGPQLKLLDTIGNFTGSGGSMVFQGYLNNGGTIGNIGQIKSARTDNTNYGGKLCFLTAGDFGTMTECFNIDNYQNVTYNSRNVSGINTISASKFNSINVAGIDGAINSNNTGVYSWSTSSRYLRFNTNGGANDFMSAGSPLVINYSGGDGGVQSPENVEFFGYYYNVIPKLTVNGYLILGGGTYDTVSAPIKTITVNAGSAQGSTYLINCNDYSGNNVFGINLSNINTNYGVAPHYYLQKSGNARFGIGLFNNENGNNETAGSDFYISNHSDDGVVISAPFSINRATGITTISDLTVTGDFNLEGAFGVAINSLPDLTSIQGQAIATTVWPFVNTMNQNVATTSSPTFVTVTGNLTGDCSGTAATVTSASQSAITTLANLGSIQGQTIAGTVWPFVNTMNQNVATTSGPLFSSVDTTNGVSAGTSLLAPYVQTKGSNGIHNIYTNTDGAPRWYHNSEDVESGNNGANLYIYRYTSTLTEAMRIRRSDGQFRIAGPTFMTTLNDNTNGNISSGTWTPTATAIENLTSVTGLDGIYTRIGNIFNVSGRFSATPSSTLGEGSLMVLEIVYPFNAASVSYAAGTVSGVNGSPFAFAGSMYTSNTTKFNIAFALVANTTLSTASNYTIYFSGSYRCD